MEKDQLVLECYRIYNESKERFIDRAFATNKFYLVLEVVLFVIVVILAASQLNTIFVIVASGFGVLVSFLWWFNQDSYQYLIKVKYRDVIEKMENDLPYAPSTMEFKAVQNDIRRKKAFVFNDAHKLLAFVVMLTFFSFFMFYLVPYLMSTFAAGLI